MLSLPIITWLRFIIWMAVGIAIYFMYGYKHAQMQAVAVPYVSKEEMPEEMPRTTQLAC